MTVYVTAGIAVTIIVYVAVVAFLIRRHGNHDTGRS